LEKDHTAFYVNNTEPEVKVVAEEVKTASPVETPAAESNEQSDL
jgi:hypothetical protein